MLDGTGTGVTNRDGMEKMFRIALLIALLSLTSVLFPRSAQAQGQFGNVIRIEQSDFAPNAGRISFSEKSLSSRNPLFRADDYGGEATGPIVTFGGFFEGQRIGKSNECPRGAALTGCVVLKPAAPLRLAGGSPPTFIASDRSNPRSPSLSGTPRFSGPVSILFDRDLAGVGLMGGFFNAPHSTAITVFDRRGRQIGGVKNVGTGMEYLALVTDDGSNIIAGLQFSLVGAEPHGFGIDDLSFAFASQMNPATLNKLSIKDVLSESKKRKEAREPKNAPAKKGGLGDLFKDMEPSPKTTNKPGLGALFKK